LLGDRNLDSTLDSTKDDASSTDFPAVRHGRAGL
jgi:hypothetical protein